MKGICFIEPLFKKTVKGTKVQTRRIISHEDFINADGVIMCTTDSNRMAHFRSPGSSEDFAGIVAKYKVGDIIYLKEPYYIDVEGQYTTPPLIYYKYSEKDMAFLNKTGLLNSIKWKNKLFMPESAARYFIKITGVRAERLQDITNEDCIKEGIIPISTKNEPLVYQWREQIGPRSAWCLNPKSAYLALIDSINGKGTWDTNPWVWVYDYVLTEREIKLNEYGKIRA